MKLNKTSLRLAMAAGLVLGAVPAFAAATAAGTSVSNTASIAFSVGGVAQTPQTSNTVSFLVDRKVNLTVVTQDASIVQVVPGQSAAVTKFLVTNNSNSTEDFILSAANSANGVTALGGTDNFDTTGLSVFVENGTTAGYQAGQDTATFIDELAPGASAIVYAVANIPAGQVNNDVAAVVLTAQAAQSTNGTGQYVATVGTLAAAAVQTNVGTVDNPAFVDTVFADAAGTTDSANDGKFSSIDAYKVVTAAITVTKSSTVISDPVNGISANAKAIPGAVIEYCLVVNNTGSASATVVTLSDAIPTNTTYQAGTIKANSTGTATTCNVGTGTAVLDAGDANGDFNVTTAGDVTLKAGTVAAAGVYRGVFRVTVN